MLASREIFDRWGARPKQYVCAWWIGKAAMNSILKTVFNYKSVLITAIIETMKGV